MSKYIRKIGTPHYYPYSDALAQKPGFVVVDGLPSVEERYFGGQKRLEVEEPPVTEVVKEVVEETEIPVPPPEKRAPFGRRPETKQAKATRRGK